MGTLNSVILSFSPLVTAPDPTRKCTFAHTLLSAGAGGWRSRGERTAAVAHLPRHSLRHGSHHGGILHRHLIHSLSLSHPNSRTLTHSSLVINSLTHSLTSTSFCPSQDEREQLRTIVQKGVQALNVWQQGKVSSRLPLAGSSAESAMHFVGI